jgi:hypothetical protein
MSQSLSDIESEGIFDQLRHARRERALLRRQDGGGALARALRAEVDADPGSTVRWGLYAAHVQACLYVPAAGRMRRRTPVPAEKAALLDPLALGRSALTPAGLWDVAASVSGEAPVASCAEDAARRAE